MEHKKITNLLNKLNPKDTPRFSTKKWVETFDFSNVSNNLNKDIRFKTSQLRSDLCDFNDAYIVVTGYFWNYYPDIPSSRYNNDNNERTRIFYPISGSESFDYKTKLVSSLPPTAGSNDAELEYIKIVVPLKNLSNFMFNLDILLINAEIELILKWSQNCVLTETATGTAKKRIPAQGDNAKVLVVPAVNTPSDLNFNITDCKLYVPVVTLPAGYENKLYKELKTGITIDFTWSKYRSQVINQTAANNLNY